MSQADDIRLLERIQAGDQTALVEIHTRYINLVYSMAYRVLGESMAAEEVAQDTFLRLWKKAYTYNAAKGRFATWLLTVTRRLAIDTLRVRQRQQPDSRLVSIDEEPEVWENVLSVEENDLRRTLRSALSGLPVDQREPIELAYFYGLSQPEIADALDVPLGTVKTRIRLGMQKLRLAWLSERSINPNISDTA
jgi:RNA polymerase sigma-70 factor (ECF subfamily)